MSTRPSQGRSTQRIPKWMLLVALAAAPSCRGCGCSCFEGPKCDLGFEDWGTGGFFGEGAGGGPTTNTCAGCDCCEIFEVCWQDSCITHGGACYGPSDCDAGEICDFSLEGELLEASIAGSDACQPMQGACVPATEGVDCVLPPATDAPSFALIASWGDPAAPSSENSVVGAPVVLQLDDDNCDGHVDAHDRGDIVFATAAQDPQSSQHGIVHAYRFEGGALTALWSSLPATPANDPASALAAARLGDAGAIIAVCTDDERIRAYDGDGSQRWLGPPSARCDSLALVDVDYDSVVDVVSESQVLDGSDGSLISEYGPAPSHGFAVIDLLPVPQLVWEIVTANRVYDHFGAVLVDTGGAEGFVAFADGVIYAVDPAAHELVTWTYDGSSVQQLAQVDLHAPFSSSCPPGSAGELSSGGPPAVSLRTNHPPGAAGVHTALGYVVYGADGSLVWAAPGEDCDAPSRGSSFFDFDGDGAAEVVRYLGQELVVHDGGDGALLQSACNTAEAGPAHPLVADVDADGFGELLAFSSSRQPASCNDTTQAGVQLLRPNAPATRTRSVYSEFSYRIANTDADGIADYSAADEAPGMRASFSTQSAVDLRLDQLPDDCASGITVRVRNVGALALAAGQATVLFLDPTTFDDLAHALIPVTLEPGAAVDVRYPDAPAEMHVVVEGVEGRPLGECDGGTQLTVSCPW